jgi:hypothetical protein
MSCGKASTSWPPRSARCGWPSRTRTGPQHFRRHRPAPRCASPRRQRRRRRRSADCQIGSAASSKYTDDPDLLPTGWRSSRQLLNDSDVSPNAPLRVSAMAWLRCRMVRQRFWLGMVIRALNAGAADTKHCRHALLPTRVIAGHGATTSRAATAMERAPWIRIRRLRVANLHSAQQRSGNDEKRNDRHTHDCLPFVVFACFACYQLAEMVE